jgi:hypothetical protein
LKFIRENPAVIIWAVAIIIAAYFGGVFLKESIECRDKGGAYLTNTGWLPVCAKVEKL